MFSAFQNILRFLVDFIADAVGIRSGCGDKRIQRLHSGIAGTFGHNIEQLSVRLFMQAIKKYDTVTELTPQVLADFIEHIEVGKCQNTSKKLPFSKRDNAVSVFFWGIGIF